MARVTFFSCEGVLVPKVSSNPAIPCGLCEHAHTIASTDGDVSYFCGLRELESPKNLATCSELKLSDKPLITLINKPLIGF